MAAMVFEVDLLDVLPGGLSLSSRSTSPGRMWPFPLTVDHASTTRFPMNREAQSTGLVDCDLVVVPVEATAPGSLEISDGGVHFRFFGGGIELVSSSESEMVITEDGPDLVWLVEGARGSVEGPSSSLGIQSISALSESGRPGFAVACGLEGRNKGADIFRGFLRSKSINSFSPISKNKSFVDCPAVRCACSIGPFEGSESSSRECKLFAMQFSKLVVDMTNRPGMGAKMRSGSGSRRDRPSGCAFTTVPRVCHVLCLTCTRLKLLKLPDTRSCIHCNAASQYLSYSPTI